MTNIAGFETFPLTYDDDGKLKAAADLSALLDRAGSLPATDAIFLAHGFRNDVDDATGVYTRFLTTLRANLARPEFAGLGDRRFVVGTVYWPSKTFSETFGEDEPGKPATRSLRNPAEQRAELKARLEAMKAHDAHGDQKAKLQRAIELLPTVEHDTAAQDEFVPLVLSLVAQAKSDKTEGLDQIKKKSGSEVLHLLSEQSAAPAGNTRGIGDVLGGIAGGIGKFLNLTTWYLMKERSGNVGATGVADAVRAMRAAHPDVRIHLVGHSLGGRLMAGCAKALCKAPKVQPDSLMLLEAAFSHYGFSADNGHQTPGFFREVITEQVVKGPFLSTFSAEDTVVGYAYSIMSRLALDNTRAIGDASDDFGGLGRNGPLKTAEVSSGKLQQAGAPYGFKNAVINNLDGSGGLIKNHGDVTNEAVTYAFASALTLT
jgi:hypothetical protein